jgi:hypothetical protein
MYIKVKSNQQKIVENFIIEHEELFTLNNKKSGATVWGQYLGNIDRNNILVTFDTEQRTHFVFCFDNKDNITEVYDVSISEERIY